jgi:hypothetical protein
MHASHFAWLSLLAALWPLPAAARPESPPIAQAIDPGDGVSQARALDLAREAAAQAGYPPADFRIASVEPGPDGGWIVRFAPTTSAAAGRRCTVHVSPGGTTRVVRGPSPETGER